ncbi:hypothetical protein TNCV_4549831 [Trichonephila clavipes]|nr:hypothetical protein TNCV_4549831 [Trichonephila clavipes]
MRMRPLRAPVIMHLFPGDGSNGEESSSYNTNTMDFHYLEHLPPTEEKVAYRALSNACRTTKKQVAGRNYPPTNKNTLIRALTEEWDKLPQQLLDNVVKSMVRRVECCITLHGGHIPYRYLSLKGLLTFRCIVPFLRTQIK